MKLKNFHQNKEFQVQATISSHNDTYKLKFLVRGPTDFLLKDGILGDKNGFAIGLWEQCCFELFLSDGDKYLEWNCSRDNQWACFLFSDYRLKERDIVEAKRPKVEYTEGKEGLELKIQFDSLKEILPQPKSFQISCILKTNDDSHFFAIDHPNEKPDFHHADSFSNF